MTTFLTEDAIPHLDQPVAVAGSALGSEQLETNAPVMVGLAIGIGVGIYTHIN